MLRRAGHTQDASCHTSLQPDNGQLMKHRLANMHMRGEPHKTACPSHTCDLKYDLRYTGLQLTTWNVVTGQQSTLGTPWPC
jgi:hypothetical protein